MSDTRMKIHTGNQRDGEAGSPATIQLTVGMRRRLSLLCETGIFGLTIEEACERLICRQLQEMEPHQ